MLKNFNISNPEYFDAVNFMKNPHEVLYDEKDGFLITSSSGVILTATTRNSAHKIFSLIPKNADLISVHGNDYEDMLSKYFPFTNRTPCVQYYYDGGIVETKTDFNIKRLDLTHLDFVITNYHSSPEYLKRLIEKGYMYGAFKGDELVGFIGRHEGLSIGLLFIHPSHRKQGLGELLERIDMNILISEGIIPVGHVIDGNDISTRLQLRLGFKPCKIKVFWYSK